MRVEHHASDIEKADYPAAVPAYCEFLFYCYVASGGY